MIYFLFKSFARINILEGQLNYMGKYIDCFSNRVKCNIGSSIGFLVILLTIIGLTIFFYYVSPMQIVDNIGVHNAYMVLAILAVIGGLSSFFAAPFYTTLIAFASADLNVIVLGLIGGVFISFGHIIYFYLGYSGQKFLPMKYQNWLDNFFKKYIKGNIAVPIVAFLYFAFTPFPNEIMLTSLGAIKYSLKKTFGLLVLGNIVLMTTIAYIIHLGF